MQKQKLEELLAGDDSREDTPWYGQLMTRPQTIAWFLQLDHWLRHYQVEFA